MVTEDLGRKPVPRGEASAASPASAASADGQRHDIPVRELTTQLGEQLTRLVREEAALARAGMFASARQAMLGGGLFGAAAVVALGAWLALVAAAIAGIAEGLPVWASALIVGGALGLLAGLLALLGRGRFTHTAEPLRMTADSVRAEASALAAAGKHGGKRR
jgi:hypothetical protein